MPYTDEEGTNANFRLMDRIKPRLTEMAIALDFPGYVIDVLGEKPNPVYYLLSEWLEGRNQVNDSRPLTWATLITALQHAGLPEEAKILEQHILVTPIATVTQTSERIGLRVLFFVILCTILYMFEIMTYIVYTQLYV